MRGRHLPIFAVALCLSTVFHAGLYTGTREIHVHAGRSDVRFDVGQPGVRSATVDLLGPDAGVKDDSAELIADLPTPPSPDAPGQPEPPAVEPEPPTPQPPPKPTVDKFPHRIGKIDGEGIGTHKADGVRAMKAPTAEADQPFLSRDPRSSGSTGDPAESTAPPGQNGTGGQPGGPRSAVDMVAPILSPPPLPMRRMEQLERGPLRPGPIHVRTPARAVLTETTAERVDETAEVRGRPTPARAGVVRGTESAAILPTLPPRADGLLPPPPSARPAASPPPAPLPLRLPDVPPILPPPETPAAAAARVTPIQPRADGTGGGGRPGPASPTADAAQDSESEVDPFSKIEAFVHRDGKVDPQFGREVKTVRPKMLPVSIVDAIMGARAVTLKVGIGRDGKVTSVNVHKTSGSSAVDQPCVVAMYDWWFEPLKDRTGRTVPDTILFTLNFR